MKRVKLKMSMASYLPVLMAVMARTSGDVLELGSGLYSTTYLHYECLRAGRNLLTCEHDPQFYEYIIKAITPWHRCELVKDWELFDLSHPWDLAFVDHAPSERRGIDACRLTHVPWVVCHDTERAVTEKYNWQMLDGVFRWSWKYRDAGRPNTTVFSNIHDLSKFTVHP